MQLPLSQRLKLIRQRALNALGLEADVRIEEAADGVYIRVDGMRIAVPSPLRWKLYRKGWAARLDRLALEYGAPRLAPLSAGSIVLDVGANAGEFAHVAARYGARVFCFEPDPGVFACLEKNIAGLANAEAISDVIWKEDGEIDFALAPERADSSVFAEGPKVKKRAVSLESFMRDRAIAHVDLLKCDAEGAEPEVLIGAGAALSQIRAVALDTGAERMGARTNVECGAILRAAGFDVIDEKIGTRQMTYGVRKDAR